MTTNVFWVDACGNERPLKFLRWTDKYLVVEYPSSGKDWRMDAGTISRLVRGGKLRIAGDIPKAFLSAVHGR